MGIFSLISITSSQVVKKYPSDIHFIFEVFLRGQQKNLKMSLY